MKKVMSLLLVMAIALTPLGLMSGCANRSEQLKLYSQGEYMDEEIFAEFEAEYLKDTGLKVKVSMDDFESNETMLTEIEGAKADYDLVCPSDYMIQKMISKDLLLEIDRDNLKIEDCIRAEYIETTKGFDPTLKYSVPYMYGTFGIMYNAKKTGGKIDSWENLFTDKYKGDIFMKKSARDSYTAAAIYSNTAKLAAASNNFDPSKTSTAEYKKLIQSIFEDTSDNMIETVKNILVTQKKWMALTYDNEQGKTDMAAGTGTAGLFWSCDAGYVMNDFENDDGTVMQGNKDLWFSIPKEGGNIYMDSFVVPKYAKNTKAANAFLKFLCKKEISTKNSIYCGAISPVTETYDSLKTEYLETALTTNDPTNIFNNVSQEWKDMYIEMLFPSQETLNRCGSMRDYKDRESKVLTMIASAMS